MKIKIYLILMLQFVSLEIWAGTISGELSYSGSFTGTVYVAAFNSPTLDGDPVYMTTLSSPGSYALNDAADGTYYVVSIMSASMPQILFTDPYGFWGTLQNLTAVVISGNDIVTGINITLVDGTAENPNPFAEFFVEPDLTIQLPTETEPGSSPSLLHTGTSIWLYKHDYPGAPSAKIFDINPETGALINTIFLSLESLPNKISWIDKLAYRNGVLWASGGYGDPLGSGNREGVFRVDIASSTSSNQIPIGSEFDNSNGLACDGSNFFISRSDSNGVGGIVKFNPDNVTVVPSELFFSLQDQARDLSYGDNFLWVGIDKVNKFNPVTAEYLESIELPGSAAEVFFDSKFWSYDEANNTIKVYYLSSVGVIEKNDFGLPIDFSLSQNYPNPFNPSTRIHYQVSGISQVSLKIYDVLGNEVAILVNEEKPAGTYEVRFDAANLSSGIYFYKLTAGNYLETKKMILMK